jgi:hypothetical protein
MGKKLKIKSDEKIVLFLLCEMFSAYTYLVTACRTVFVIVIVMAGGESRLWHRVVHGKLWIRPHLSLWILIDANTKAAVNSNISLKRSIPHQSNWGIPGGTDPKIKDIKNSSLISLPGESFICVKPKGFNKFNKCYPKAEQISLSPPPPHPTPPHPPHPPASVIGIRANGKLTDVLYLHFS